MSKTPGQLSLSPATRAVQALHAMDERTGAVVPSIDLATTFARDGDYQPRQSYIYGRDGGPTTKQAEAIVADLDGSGGTLLFGSGMAAVVALFETLDRGDHVVLPEIMYHGALDWVRRLRDKRGIEVTQFDATKDGALAAAMQKNTRLVWIETPTNPSWDVIDIAAAADIAHAAGAILAVDCTVAPPVTMQTLALGADVAFQSVTKYLNGHSDVLGGALSFAKSGPLLNEVTTIRKMLGSVMGGFEAWLLIRGLRTLYLRYERSSANALTLAQHFEGHAIIEAVLYPGLPSHPGHEVAKRQMQGGFGGMISLLLKGGEEQARDVARFTQLFFPATSLGGVESLIEHRKSVEGPHSKVAPNLLRLSVGIEDVRDLIADVQQALERSA